MTVAVFSRVLGLLCCVFVVGLQTTGAHAQYSEGVRLEGKMAYRFSRVGRGPWGVTASVSRLVNYDYSDRAGLKALLILSPKGYRPGTNLKGLVAAKTPLGYLEARTAYSGVAFSGRTKVKPGRYVPVLAVVDENNYIEHAVNFPKKAAFKTQSRAFRRNSRALDGEHLESLVSVEP